MEMKTDFEKLVVARKYVTALEQENKRLKKEVVMQFKAAKAVEKALEKERKIKSDLYVQELKNTIKALRAKLEAAINQNSKLVYQLIMIKAEAEQTDGHKMHELRPSVGQSLMTKLKRFFQKVKTC